MLVQIGSIITGLLLAQCLAAVQPLGNLFHVSTNTGDAGNCAQYQTQLEKYINECDQLVNAALHAVNDYTTDDAAKRLVDSFFFEPDASIRTIMINNLSKVSAFLTSNTQPLAYLFCNADWLQKKQLTDPALDSSGNTYQDAAGQTVTIGAAYSNAYQSVRSQYANNIKVIPWYSPQLGEYLFDQAYGSGGTNFCSNKLNLGATQEETSIKTVTLCPQSFTGISDTLGAVAPAPIPLSQVKQGNKNGAQELNDVKCNSLTLFHELFHLVLGKADTPDYEYDLPAITTQTASFGSSQAAMNPESYTLVALAAFYTTNHAGIEYATGVCTDNNSSP